MYLPSHYLWAGLDFIFDRDCTPVLLEANRASHMLGEYMEFFGDEKPFELTAAVMNEAAGPPCFLWRRGDPFPDADEDVCFISNHLRKYLRQQPLIANVEDNSEPATELVTRDGQRVRPGSIFRWWYGLPWTFERSGVRVINSNAAWLAVRDKLLCYETLQRAKSFRVPRSFPVESIADVNRLLATHLDLFQNGYVLKPRVGWGGQFVQVADAGAPPLPFEGHFLLSERIVPQLRNGRYWDVRAFVMAGVYLGGIIHSSSSGNTNYWRGGQPEPLDADLSRRLEPAALEAVQLLDEAAARIHAGPIPRNSPLTDVIY